MPKQNIILVGFMGTGKTTVGTLLSERTGFPLIDMDSQIEAEEGRSINDIFAQSGEPYFRQLEREMVQKLSKKSGCIISTGGGIVLNPENISDFAQSGLVVCLSASPEKLLERLKNDSTRPLLARDKQDQIIQLLADRKPLYEAIDFQIQTDALSPDQIAEQIIARYNKINP